MSQIPREIIEQVREASDIVDVISRYVDLKQRGINFFGLCPFHNEKTPSFSVAPNKQIYHCFGCNAGGNVFSFLMDFQKIQFPEAVKSLANHYNIPIEFDSQNIGSEIFSALYEIHEIAVKLYQNNLFSKDGETSLDYLFNRGLHENTIKEFKIGYAKDSWNQLVLHCKGRGFSQSQIIKSGLFTYSEKGIFDRFRDRIMFPIFHQSGKIIAFGGRTLRSSEPAKYLNSPETPLYKKGNVFYGIHSTSGTIRRDGYAVLVEGYMDFLKLYQQGIKSVLALSGTAFTKKHAIVLSRITSKVVLLYDGDQAGANAAIRAGWILIKSGLEPSIVQPPKGMDPDIWIDSESTKIILSKIESPKDYINFNLDLNKSSNLKGIDKKKYIIYLAKEIKNIEDGIIRNDIIRIVSAKLKIDEKDFIRVMKTQNVIQHYNDQNIIPESSISFTGKIEKAQIELLNLLASNIGSTRDYVIEHVSLELFTTPLLKKLAEYLMNKNLSLESSSIIEYFEDKNERSFVTKILFNQKQSDVSEEIVSDCIKILKSEPLKQKINDLRIQIREKELKGEDPMKELNVIGNLRKELNDL